MAARVAALETPPLTAGSPAQPLEIPSRRGMDGRPRSSAADGLATFLTAGYAGAVGAARRSKALPRPSLGVTPLIFSPTADHPGWPRPCSSSRSMPIRSHHEHQRPQPIEQRPGAAIAVLDHLSTDRRSRVYCRDVRPRSDQHNYTDNRRRGRRARWRDRAGPDLNVVVFDSVNPDFYLAHYDLDNDPGKCAALGVGPTGPIVGVHRVGPWVTEQSSARGIWPLTRKPVRIRSGASFSRTPRSPSPSVKTCSR